MKIRKFFLSAIMFTISAVAFASPFTVYFNMSPFYDALDERIIDLINSASNNISAHFYDIDRQNIVDAFLSAANRGVKIRIITDSDNWNDYCDQLNSNPNINVINDLKSTGYEVGSRQSHNKFMVVDYGSTNSPVSNTVWTGSYNITDNGTVRNANDVVVVQNYDVATAYWQEFNEMWGGTNFEFNASESRFGSQKTDPPPDNHYFTVSTNYTNLEVWFSPEDDVNSKIVSIINSAKQSIHFCIFTYTEDSIADAMLDALVRGVEVAGVFDTLQASSSYSEYSRLDSAIDIGTTNRIVKDAVTGLLHHKYMIIDVGTTNATVIVGSHNWTASANSVNDENVMIIRDQEVAEKFFEEFQRRYYDAGGSELGVQAPEITSFEPVAAPVGATVTVNGVNFGSSAGKVYIGTNEASVSSWSEDEIQFTVPTNAENGIIKVVSSGGVSGNSSRIFVVIKDEGQILVNEQTNIDVSGTGSDSAVRVGVFDANLNVSSLTVKAVNPSSFVDYQIHLDKVSNGIYIGSVKFSSLVANEPNEIFVHHKDTVYFIYDDPDDGTGSPKSITNQITWFNSPPTASVESGTINTLAGELVHLTGIANDPDDGDIDLQSRWIQTSGPSVVIINSNSETATFTAPPYETTLTFSYEVSDGINTSQPATVRVNVLENAKLVDDSVVKIYPTIVSKNAELRVSVSAPVETSAVYDLRGHKISDITQRDENGNLLFKPADHDMPSGVYVVFIKGARGGKAVKKFIYVKEE